METLREQNAAEAHRIHGHIPDLLRAMAVVGYPSVGPVELLRASVAGHHPQHRTGVPATQELASNSGCERPSDSAAPAVGLDVERTQLSLTGCVLIPCR